MSYYFPPDLSAGSFRCSAIAKALKQEFPKTVDIQIITTTPNRYDSFSLNAPEKEELTYASVYRCSVGRHRGSLIGQCLSFLSFALNVKKITKVSEYDFVVATSSRLMTAVLGAHIAKKKKIPLFLDIRDIFADSVKSVVPFGSKYLVARFFQFFEGYTLNYSTWINLVSPGFLPYFQYHFSTKNFYCYTNGIDDEFVRLPLRKMSTHNSSGPLKILYAGNIGDGQGLHRIIPQMALAADGLFEFLVIGDGGRKSALEKEIKKFDLKNIELKGPMSRCELVNIYVKCDILFLHLNMFEAFSKVLPSKIFEYAATGKPILAGVEGFSKSFILDNVDNAEVFTPGDSSEAIAALSRLQRVNTDRQKFVETYNRKIIMKKMVRNIVKTFQQDFM